MFLISVYSSEGDKQTDMTDNELMAQVVSGGKRAMKSLVEKYKKRAFYIALGMVGNKDEAYDISQDAFIRVFKSAEKFNQEQRFFPWFYSIITNLCRDCLLRRRTKESREVDIDDNEYLLVADSNPEAQVIRDEEAKNVRSALMKLDFEDREIIMLKHFKDHSYDEIAHLLKIPKGTVMSRLYYARKKLAKELAYYE